MGVEYYLVKPDKQEIFYLGRHMHCPEGIHFYSQDAHWIDYYSYDEFFWDFLQENYEEFLCTELNLEHLRTIIFEVYEWCRYDKVYFDSDCNDEAPWLEWKETGSLQEHIEKAHLIQDINNIVKGRQLEFNENELAKYLFNGDSEKAKILLELIHNSNISEIKEVLPVNMYIPEDTDD